MGWTIEPTDGGASINQTTGEATFQPNTGTTDKVYTITYVDSNDCSASTTYTVTRTTEDCMCSNISASYSLYTFKASGETITAATITSPCTTSNFTVSDVPDWLTTGTTSDGITLTAPSNTGAAKPTATIKFMLNGSTECFTMSVSQQAGKDCRDAECKDVINVSGLQNLDDEIYYFDLDFGGDDFVYDLTDNTPCGEPFVKDHAQLGLFIYSDSTGGNAKIDYTNPTEGLSRHFEGNVHAVIDITYDEGTCRITTTGESSVILDKNPPETITFKYGKLGLTNTLTYSLDSVDEMGNEVICYYKNNSFGLDLEISIGFALMNSSTSLTVELTNLNVLTI